MLVDFFVLVEADVVSLAQCVLALFAGVHVLAVLKVELVDCMHLC